MRRRISSRVAWLRSLDEMESTDEEEEEEDEVDEMDDLDMERRRGLGDSRVSGVGPPIEDEGVAILDPARP